MTKLFARLFADQSGTTSIEYAMIAAGIGMVIIAAVNLVGTTLDSGYQKVADGFN